MQPSPQEARELEERIERIARRIRRQAMASVVVLLVGVGVAMIPWLGTGLVVFIGWIPLLIWMLIGIVSLVESVQLRRDDLAVYSVFVAAMPIVVYGFHLRIMSSY